MKIFSSFFKTPSKEIVVIEIGSSNFKMVLGNYSLAKKDLSFLLNKNITGLSDNDIANIIKESLHKLKVKTSNIAVVLPSHLAITKNIEIPSTNPKEIKEIINLQAYRHTPFSREEIIVDYIDLGTYKHSYTKILLIIVTRQVVKRYFDILEKAYINLDHIFFMPEVLAISAFELFKIESNNFPVSLVHIDEAVVDFLVILREKVIFSRSIPIGIEAFLLDREKIFLRFAEEIKKSLEAYQSEDIEKIPQILFLTGVSEIIADAESSLTKILHLPVKTISYSDNIFMSKEVKDTLLSSTKLSFLNVIGALVAFGRVKINLLPEDIKLRKIFEEKSKELIKTGVYLTIFFVLFFFTLISKIYFKTLYLKNIKNQYKSLAYEAEKLQKDYEKVTFIRRYISSRGNSLEILTELYDAVPPEIELADIRLDENKRMSLRGVADSMSVVFSFAERLGKSEYFKDVRTRYTSKRKESVREVTDFEIVLFIDEKNIK